jgi:hypothetical protein
MQYFLAAVDPNAKPAVTPPANSNTAKPRAEVIVPKIDNPFPVSTVPGLASRVITILLALIVIAAVVMIVVSGFRMLAGGANPDEIKKAKKGIIWSLIGLVVAFMAFAVVQIIQAILK